MILIVKDFLFWQPASFSFNSVLFFFSHWFLWLVILGLSLWWLAKNRTRRLGLFWLLLVSSELLEAVIKYFSPWDRPFYQNGVHPPEWIGSYSYGSFPSGHAMRSAIALCFLWQEDKKMFWFLLPGIVLVNLGRILFSLHYPIDIIGGLILGFILVKSEQLIMNSLVKS